MLFILMAYLAGSIPSGVLVARALGLHDPRSNGSGNIGASNMARVGGRKAAVITFFLDFLKGCLPVTLALLLNPDQRVAVYLTAIATVLGHCYSIFLFFKGGKGVATAAGALLPLATAPLLIVFLAWSVCFYCFRITSAAAMAALLCLMPALFISGANTSLLLVSLGITLIVVRRHAENLESLLDGRERRF